MSVSCEGCVTCLHPVKDVLHVCVYKIHLDAVSWSVLVEEMEGMVLVELFGRLGCEIHIPLEVTPNPCSVGPWLSM